MSFTVLTGCLCQELQQNSGDMIATLPNARPGFSFFQLWEQRESACRLNGH